VDKPQSEIVARYEELPEDPFAAAPAVEPQARRDHGPALVGPVVPDPGEPEAEVLDAIQPRAGEPSRTAAAVSRPWPLDGFPLGFRVVPGGLFPTYSSTSGGVGQTDLTAAGNAAVGDGSVTVVTGERLAVTAGRSSPRVPLDSGKAAYERGRDDLRRKDYKRAVEAFTEAIRHDPGHADAHYWRGLAEHLDGRLSQALADYGEAIRRSPDNADAFLLRGQVYRALGAPERAAADLGAAVLRRPGDVAARVARGQVYHELGDYEKALADLDEAIRLRPDDASVHYRRGLVRYHTGDLAGAVADYSTAIRLEPNHANAYRARSEAFARRGLLDRATADRDAYDRLVARQAGSRPKGRFSTQKVTSPHG
jgi:Tfp pilus assembly protein PilF